MIDIFLRGGPVMWPILALSLAGLATAADRFFAFRRFFADKTPRKNPQAALNSLQRGFGFISTAITAEPLLGILGTVTGIIGTFDAFGASGGGDSPLAATAGIGEALITTAAGLVAALALLFPYNMLLALLSRAAERLERDGEEAEDNA